MFKDVLKAKKVISISTKGFLCGFVMCLHEYDLEANLFPHVLQAKDLSPVWICMCIFNFDLEKNLFPHASQAKGLFPVWIFMCVSRFNFQANLPCITDKEFVSCVDSHVFG
ncbi:hypothetical protein AMECASPLE_038025 [Ameca splendens]|uniref:Uncharacterized protein n=1 Tax=Ameca splendens TaxID=208324 RepID=A0ABV0Z5Y1_9TELE